MKRNNIHKIVWEKFSKAARKGQLVLKNDRVLVALSGGTDSMCLAHMLFRLRKIINFDLAAAYIDHGLRPAEVKKEIRFVQSEMKKLGIPLFIIPVKVEKHKSGTEANARKVRYRALAKIAIKNKYSKIATGHTLDDQAETVLLNIIRSKCEEGIEGIPVQRHLGNIRVIRPVLSIRKEEILKYLDNYNIKYCVDSSNKKSIFSRNLVRLKVMPVLKSINPCVLEHLSNLSKSSGLMEEYLEEEARKSISNITSRQKNEIRLDLLIFMKYNFCLKRKIIKLILEEFSTKAVYSLFINQVFDFLDSRSNSVHSGNLRLTKSIKYLIFKKA